jgi:hypothetical protein
MKTVIRTFEPDWAYQHPSRQADPYELIGIAVDHHGKELFVTVQDSPYIIAGALEAIACAIRRTWII